MDRARAMYPEIFKETEKGDVSCLQEIHPRDITKEDTVMMDPKLYKAAKDGDVKYLKAVLQRSDDEKGDVSCLREIHPRNIAREVDVDPKLYRAAKEGDVKCLKAVLQRSRTEKVDSQVRRSDEFFRRRTQYNKNNILHIAARAGRDIFVKEVHSCFPCLSDQVNSQGDTPLLVAARFGHLKVVEALVDGKFPIQDDMATAVENGTNLSSRSRPRDVEEGLIYHQSEQGIAQDGMATTLENGTNSNNNRRQHDVEEEGLLHLQLDMLIPAPFRVTNEQSNTVTTALHEALRNGHQKVARYLLGLKPEQAEFDNLAGESPLFLAAESRCELFMLDILQSKRPYSTKGPNGLNALHAARECYDTIIRELIRQKPDLMRKLDNHGKAAIHHAVEADYWVLLDQMLEADATIALLPDAEGYTPLLRASSRGSWQMCKKILKVCPESIEARNDKGQNALHLCKFRAYTLGKKFVNIPEIWELLNEGDNEGNTPLHLAVKEHYCEKAMLLTSSVSIDLGAANKEGLTALDLCESSWNLLGRQKLMWFHLRRHKAPRGRHPNDQQKVPVGGIRKLITSPDEANTKKTSPDEADQKKTSADENLKSFINTMALVAALIATLTFAAAFTMPGGYDNSPDNSGVATLIKKTALKVFILSDTLAMCCSITVVFLLSMAIVAAKDIMFQLVNSSSMLLAIALLATLVAFMSGIFAVIAPKALWVAILVVIGCSTTPFTINPGRVQTHIFVIWLTRDIIRSKRQIQEGFERWRDHCDIQRQLKKE